MDRTRGLWADLGSNPRGLEAYFRQIQLKHGVWSPVFGSNPVRSLGLEAYLGSNRARTRCLEANFGSNTVS